ncbi:MAG: T9SS type A sorting domain-containing protein, partial [Saprospiraceae bacterium]
ATEKNNAYFSVQRSADGITWQEINQVEGAIHSTAIKDYTDWDYAPFQGINYYRLKQYDIDGNFSFSPIKVEIINQNQNFSAFLYPNPGADKFHLQIERTSDQKYHINILNQVGIRMQAQIDEEGAFKGKMQYLIDTQDFPSGYYQVLITSDNGNIIKALPLIKK